MNVGKEFMGESKGVLQLKIGSESNEAYFHDLPSMVQGGIVHDFVMAETDVKPDFPTVRRVLDLARTNTQKLIDGSNDSMTDNAERQPHFGVLINKRTSISDAWEVWFVILYFWFT